MKISKFRVYKYLSYNKHKILKVLFLIVVIVLASVPVILLLKFLPQGTSMSFTLEYDNSDPNFGIIDYSGIEYYLDGQLFTTDSSGLIEVFISGINEYNLTIYFGGETITRIFNKTSISETIKLTTKSINGTVMWDEIFVPNDRMIEVILQYYNGINWIDIESGITDINGLVNFSGLVIGNYRIENNEFTVEQSTITYTTDILVDAVKTIIDVDYNKLLTIFGNNYPVDLSTIAWEIRCIQNNVLFNITKKDDEKADGLIVNNETGVITIYNILHQTGISWQLRILNYNGVITNYAFTDNEFNQIELVAKSLELRVISNFEEEPAVGFDFELFYLYKGTEFISIGIFTTDINGLISISETLPIGTYYFEGQSEFSITAEDTMVVVNYTIEPIREKESFFT